MSFKILQREDTENQIFYFYSVILFIYIISILSTIFPENEKHKIIVLSSVFQNCSPILDPNVSDASISALFRFVINREKLHLLGWKDTLYKSCGSIPLPGLHKTYLGQGQTPPLFQLSIP